MTFAGVETFLIYQQGVALRDFCSFDVLDDDDAWARFEAGFLRPIAATARRHGFALLTDTLGWRASPDWVARPGDVRRFARLGASRVRRFLAGAGAPAVLSADLGPRGDGYALEGPVTPEAAAAYHRPQLEACAEAGVELVTAWTMTSVAESVGIARACREVDLPVAISPTLETDGALVDGASLGELVARVDDATGGYPLFYAANCVHPAHVAPTLRAAREADAPWLARFRGLRVNASRKSHAELDASTELDRGDPMALARELAALAKAHELTVLGGCCGTDPEHLARIAEAVAPLTTRGARARR